MFLKKLKGRVSDLESVTSQLLIENASLTADLTELKDELLSVTARLEKSNKVLCEYIREHYKGRNPPPHVESWIESVK